MEINGKIVRISRIPISEGNGGHVLIKSFDGCSIEIKFMTKDELTEFSNLFGQHVTVCLSVKPKSESGTEQS